MIDELANRDVRGELGQPAEVVGVPMRDDQMVDLLKAGVLDGIPDAAGIASGGRAGVAGIDQQRFTRGGNKKRGIASLDVDHRDAERFRARRRRKRHKERRKGENQQKNHGYAHRPSRISVSISGMQVNIAEECADLMRSFFTDGPIVVIGLPHGALAESQRPN